LALLRAEQVGLHVHLSTGLFAGESIPQGTFIGVYAGEIITIEEAMKRGSYVMSSFAPVGPTHLTLTFRIYDELGISYLFDLDFEESLNSQKESANTSAAFSVDARYFGNVSRAVCMTLFFGSH